MVSKALYSKATDEWATPQLFFDAINETGNFTLDPCATPENAKCENYYTKEQNGLLKSWHGERVFCNPPYSQISKWVQKASMESAELIVMLIPARTDTRWFHDYIYKKPNVHIDFIKGRLKFGESKNSAPFPSMLVSFVGGLK